MHKRRIRSAILLVLMTVAITIAYLNGGIPGADVEARDHGEDNPSARPLPDVDEQLARDLLSDLEVRPKDPGGDYERDAFGPAWYDVDSNGCDTRNDILARDLIDQVLDDDACTVLTGVLVYEPYLGEWHVEFERGVQGSGLDNEHIVALANAWVTGAKHWDEDQRVEFANDPLNLMMVDPGQNRAKGAADAAEWMPPNADFHCEYAATQITIKAEYGLWVTPAEHDALEDALDTC